MLKLAMHLFAVIFIFLQVVPINILAKSKYTDEDRPYEFGFNIEGQQHRREKKDENGLIMGEFGFITADGVYHVTVYATDENGNFKIISMKNIRLGPSPEVTPRPLLVLTSTLPPLSPSLSPVVSGPSSPSVAVKPSYEQSASYSTPRPAILTTPSPLPIGACSHCSIPSTTRPPPPNPPPNYNRPLNPSQNLEAPPRQSPANNQAAAVNSQYPQDQNNDRYQQNQPLSQNPAYPQNSVNPQNPAYPQDSSFAQNPSYPLTSNFQPESQSPVDPAYQNQLIDQQTGPSTQSPSYSVAPNDVAGSPNFNPILISAQMRPVNPAAVEAGQSLKPGENPGLPAGVTEDDMVGILYKFNYTVGFHSHHEEGYASGVKIGEYYVNHRNGLATKVSYVADSTGFHPKIKTVRISDIETPKEETEKNEEYGLKGYEFTWFYVPKYHYLNQQ